VGRVCRALAPRPPGHETQDQKWGTIRRGGLRPREGGRSHLGVRPAVVGPSSHRTEWRGFSEARLADSGLRVDGVVRVVVAHGMGPVVGFNLGWRDNSDRAFEAAAVVPVDVIGDGELSSLTDLSRAVFRAATCRPR